MKPTRTLNFLSVIALATASITTLSAQAGPYDFGGSCPSQGAWTQMALQQTQAIAEVVRQLKDNPACKGIETVVADLNEATHILDTPKDEVMRESKLESLPTEMNAIRSTVISDGNVDNGSANMLMNRTLEAAQISSQLNQNSSPVPSTQADIGSIAGNAIKSLFTRYADPTRKGMELVSKIFETLPKYDECLIGQPQQGMALLGGAVKIAASFSAAGEGVGNSLGNAISNLTTMLRDRRFTLALRKTDETQFWFSVSCLIESTAKNYCDAENAQEILQYSQDQYQEAMKRNLVNRKADGYDNPLEGYYLLVRELPVISGWLQQVQFGVAPKLGADADFKNKIWDQVTQLTKDINTLTGYFNEQMLFMHELTDAAAKRNQLFNMLSYLVSQMSDPNSMSSQFFTTTVNPTLLPFYLVGLDAIPSDCVPQKGQPANRWDTWMKTSGTGGGYNAQFADPDKLAMVIESRMQEVITGASVKSSAYFRQRLIMDMPNLVNQTLTGQYMTVRKAFENTYNYLVRFESKLSNDDLNLVMIPSVRETRTKILKFLKSYDKLHDLGKKMILAPDQTPLMLEQVNGAAKEVIDTIFTEFNVLFQKDTFLTNRLTTYIDKDFSMRIQAGLNMTPYQNDLMVITQKHLLEKLTEVHGLNPTNAVLDLGQAQVVNKRNLESLEEVFKDSLYKTILQVKAVADGQGDDEVSRNLDQKFSEERSMVRRMGWYMSALDPLFGFTNWLMAGPTVRSAHPDLYQDRSNPNKVTGQDDKFGSFAQFQAKLCAQTLAFEDRGYFYDLCKGTVLKSFYSGKGNSKLDLKYNDFMPNASAGARIRKSPDLASKNICAFNDFTLKNMVKWLKDQDAEMYQETTLY